MTSDGNVVGLYCMSVIYATRDMTAKCCLRCTNYDVARVSVLDFAVINCGVRPTLCQVYIDAKSTVNRRRVQARLYCRGL